LTVRERESVCVSDSLVSAFIKENLDCLFDTLPALPLFAFVYKSSLSFIFISVVVKHLPQQNNIIRKEREKEKEKKVVKQ